MSQDENTTKSSINRIPRTSTEYKTFRRIPTMYPSDQI